MSKQLHTKRGPKPRPSETIRSNGLRFKLTDAEHARIIAAGKRGGWHPCVEARKHLLSLSR